MAKPKPLPPVETLREYFSYDPETGIVTRLKKTNYNQCVGEVVGSQDPRGYIYAAYRGQRILLHRLAWKLMTGQDPVEDIDHKNQAKNDNRWCNLREADKSQNHANITRSSRYLPGVQRNGQKWIAKGGGHNTRHLGTFDTEQEAHDAYVKWHREHYGEFSVYASPCSWPAPVSG